MRILTAALVGLATLGYGQTSPSFEVASVKASSLAKAADKRALEEHIEPEPNGLTMTSVSLRSCMQWAYDVRPFQISGPGWIETELHGIVAKAGGAVSTEELRHMLQTLL